MAKLVSLETEKYLNQLDMDRVADEIRNTDGFELAEFDLETAAEMVWTAAGRWLVDDLNKVEILGVEEYWTYPFQDRRRSGVFDLRGRILETGAGLIMDWKTTKSKLDERWEGRYRDSWQNKLYLYASGADAFVYRGVNRDMLTRSVVVPRQPALEDQVDHQLLGIAEMQRSLAHFHVYPRNMPHACGAFGRECQYMDDCRNYTMPKKVIKLDSLNASGMDNFLLCPERFRRDELAEAEGEDGGSWYDAEFGLAVHRGLAELYRQAAKEFQGRVIPRGTR